MKILEFVITGGPCAGKTTAINIVKQELENKGFKVIVAAETATELVSSGIYPWELKPEEFQTLLISRAINKEEIVRKAAKFLKKNTIIIYDRGILDCKAYMSYDFFKKQLKKYNMDEENVREKYDGVFHLVTAANGAEEFYTLSNNEARKETIEEARSLDKKTIEVWKSHSNFKIIDNSTNFQNKIDRLLKEIYLSIEYGEWNFWRKRLFLELLQ